MSNERSVWDFINLLKQFDTSNKIRPRRIKRTSECLLNMETSKWIIKKLESSFRGGKVITKNEMFNKQLDLSTWTCPAFYLIAFTWHVPLSLHVTFVFAFILISIISHTKDIKHTHKVIVIRKRRKIKFL